MTNAEIHEQYLKLEAEIDTAKKALEKFRKDYAKELDQHRASVYLDRRTKEKKRKDREKEIGDKIIDYVQPGMWVKVKTNSGSIWQQIMGVHKEADTRYYKHNVTCARPNNPKHVSYNRHTEKYSAPQLMPENIFRSDVYVVSALISVLAPDGNGFYEEKSFRKDLFKE